MKTTFVLPLLCVMLSTLSVQGSIPSNNFLAIGELTLTNIPPNNYSFLINNKTLLINSDSYSLSTFYFHPKMHIYLSYKENGTFNVLIFPLNKTITTVFYKITNYVKLTADYSFIETIAYFIAILLLISIIILFHRKGSL